MWWTTFDMIESATIASSLGTLAIALCSLYQTRRSVIDSFVPVLSIDGLTVHSDELSIRLRNYGTGPALDVTMLLRSDNHVFTPDVFLDGYPISVLHVGTNESKEVCLKPKEQPVPDLTRVALTIQFECIRRRHRQANFSVASFLCEHDI
ncbi:hypothetical protein [Alicyclobacillus acidoterrestris]|uniref:Uncharacterized protein n=1 Tax=Alicyclobacillus acidoterrestris (strain ATCC 49025 / DSM 3922 / CIP 106132 / NCIMB 13137 / GD3B) TaxID=1356854 RepID=T0BM86_ALIAG|nr:hypothetical protein [Alicyclobacillus acidoterrestris]EPZ45103.1 hypothetical protein N007_09850 [Alicyclobacillus acidoterrestris ATCC 49025]UNO48391.1 hypothetical protein K1I37_17225 [Alicyclobacillus acidoterrestris]